MTGVELKTKLMLEGIQITKLADMLNISQSNLSQQLNAADIKSGLLERICKVLGHDMSFFYPECRKEEVINNVCGDGNTNVVGNNSSATAGADTEAINKMAEQIEALVRANERLLEMNHELMMKIIQ